MTLTLNFSLIYIFVYLEVVYIVGSSHHGHSFTFEALQRRMEKNNKTLKQIPRYIFPNKAEHPDPLPDAKLSPIMLKTPFHSIYQGSRRPNDTRVYRRQFTFEAKERSHHAVVEGNLDCRITYLAIETKGGVPILLRGGAGYTFFMAVTKAKANEDLVGSVRAYCVIEEDDYYKTRRKYPKFYK